MRISNDIVECLTKDGKNCEWNMCPRIDALDATPLSCSLKRMNEQDGWCAKANDKLHKVYQNHASKGIIPAPMSSELEIPWTCVEGLGAPMRLRHGFVECLAKNNTQNCAWNMCPFIDDTTISVLTCDEEKMEAKHGWCAQAKHKLHEIFLSHEMQSFINDMASQIVHIAQNWDSWPDSKIESSCRGLRFLNAKTRSSDMCVGEGHHDWSFSCAMAEARLLGRVLIYPTKFCLHCQHMKKTCARNHKKGSLWFDDVGEFLSKEKLLHWPAMDLELFQKTCGRFVRDPVLELTGGNLKVLHSSSTILERSPTFYYAICDAGIERHIIPERTSEYHYLTRPMVNVQSVVDELNQNGPFLGLHIRRGDKVNELKDKTPHLDFDTQPEQLHHILKSRGVTPNTTVYIASDELDPAFFFKEPLINDYSIFTIQNFSLLLDVEESQEWNLFTAENYILHQAGLVMDAFNEFTSDCKNVEKHNCTRNETFIGWP